MFFGSSAGGVGGGDSLSIAGSVVASDYTAVEGQPITFTFTDNSIDGVVTANDYTAVEGQPVTLEYTPVVNTYQWKTAAGENIPGEIGNTTVWDSDTNGQPVIQVTNPNTGKSKVFRAPPVTVESGEFLETTLMELLPPATNVWGWKRQSLAQPLALKIRNDANELLDIAYDGNWIDGQAILDHCGSGDGFVHTAYCSGGDGNDEVETDPDKQPKIVSAGVPIVVEYCASILFDGTDNILETPLITWGSKVTSLTAILSGLDSSAKIGVATGDTYAAPAKNFYAPVLNGTGPRVGYANNGVFGFYDYTGVGRYGVGMTLDSALAEGSQCVPILNDVVSQTGWAVGLATGPAVGNLDNSPLRIGGDTRADYFGLMGVCGWYANAGTVEDPEDVTLIAKSIGVAASGILLGDSTVVAYSGTNAVASYMFSGADFFRTYGIKDLSHAGDDIAAQKAAWSALTTRHLAQWVIIEVGLNDMDPSDGTTASKIAEYQDLVDTIRADNADIDIILNTMGPAYERWATLGYNSAQAQARWVAMNDAIMGRGASPITGVQHRSEEATLAVAKDVSGNAALADAYETVGVVDHIHVNNDGRTIKGSENRTSLLTVGHL